MARKTVKCYDCGLDVKKDEIALSKKYIGRETISFMCISCLAEFLSCSVDDLQIKILEFKEQGCALFL